MHEPEIETNNNDYGMENGKDRAIDSYLDALLINPQALPPADLDDATIEVLKALVATKYNDAEVDSTYDSVQERVWSRVVFATYAPPEVEPTYVPIMPAQIDTPSDVRHQPTHQRQPASRSSHRGTITNPVRSSQRVDIPFLIAAVFALVCLTGLFIQHTDSGMRLSDMYTIQSDYESEQTPLPATNSPLSGRFLPGFTEFGRDSVKVNGGKLDSIKRTEVSLLPIYLYSQAPE